MFSPPNVRATWSTWSLSLALAACGANLNPVVDGASAPPAASPEPTVPAAVVTPTAAPAGPDEATLARLAAAKQGFTATAATPMGDKFAVAAATATTPAQTSALLSGALLPPVPPAQTNMKWLAFPVTLYGDAGPSPSDIHQRGLGTCGGVAALGGLAFQNANFVRRCIVAEPNNMFRVHMFDPQGLAIDVVIDSQFVASNDNVLLQAGSRQGTANWVTVLEKATMVYNAVFQIFDDTSTPGGTGGIGAEYQLPLFTGHGSSFAYYSGILSAQDLRAAVMLAMQHGCIVTGGFAHNTVVNAHNVFSYHAYSVFGVGNAAGLMAQMRNPWGYAPFSLTGEGDFFIDGVSTIALDDPASALVDLRIIEAGAAQAGGRTAPFLPL